MDRTYTGHRIYKQRSIVLVTDKEGDEPYELDPGPSLAIMNHSPTGFEWGYGGSGPAQLALALLLHEGVEADEAINLHRRFKGDVVAKLGGGWTLRGLTIQGWIARHRS